MSLSSQATLFGDEGFRTKVMVAALNKSAAVIQSQNPAPGDKALATAYLRDPFTFRDRVVAVAVAHPSAATLTPAGASDAIVASIIDGVWPYLARLT